MGLKTLKRVVKNHPYLIKRKYKTEIALLQNSELFSSKYYLWKHEDVASDKFWSKNPILHFLLIGGSERRQCSKWFDTEWYVEHYEDVAQENMNPLVHYLRYGQKEGRRISGKKYTERTRDEREKLRNSTVKHLWGGYSEAALQDLKDIYTSEAQHVELRYFAAWHAARWYFYVQAYDTLLKLAELVVSLDNNYIKEKNTVMMFTSAYLAMGEKTKARTLAERYLIANKNDTDMLLVLANTYDNDETKLKVVNSIFEQRRLAVIDRIDATKPLSFSNIQASCQSRQHSQKVSVIMPTYNAEDKISAALYSLLNQSWKNLEIIVVDDCSTDDTVNVASKVAEIDSRVKVFKQEKNGGAYLARNRGLREADGDFITTHDSDDWSHPQKIETQMDLLLRKAPVMGVCTYWTRALDDLTFTHNWNLNEKLLQWNHSSFLFRREVLSVLGPWDSVIIGGDTEFIWRVQAHYGKSAVVKYKPNIPFSFALDDDASLTRAKATHVSTIHLGLRNLYRNAAKWWHETSTDLSVHGNNRPFAAPKPMLKRGDNQFSCDVLYIADFSQEATFEVLKSSLEEDTKKENFKIGLLHWPEYGKDKEEPLSTFFEFLNLPSVYPVVYGMEVTCSLTITPSKKLFKEKLEKVPLISTDRVTYVDQHKEDNDLGPLKDYVSLAKP